MSIAKQTKWFTLTKEDKRNNEVDINSGYKSWHSINY